MEGESPSFFDLYEPQLYSLPIEGSKSLVIDFPDLYISNPDLAVKLIESPETVLKDLEEEAKAKLKFRCPEYLLEVEDIHIRVRNLPETLSVRDIKSRHISHLIQVRGIVTRVSIPSPEPVKSVYKCQSCGETYITEKDPPKSCENCKGRKFEFVEEESTYVDTQKIRIQESPEDLPPGQIPHYVDIILRDDLVNTVNPGDYIQCTAIVHVKKKRGNPSLKLLLEANHIEPIGKEGGELELTQKDEEEIRKLSKDPNIYEKIIASIAPGIKGLRHIKEAVALQLFGGVPKQREGHRIRGDIHILLVGDPGTGRSQLLQYVARLSPRGMYTSGRGASAAGLTAALVRDESGSFSLEAGALVLMDGGICCIDEIEKMRNEDRVALHPAMEQQIVTISKGGINAELNARTAILAAANPSSGRYNPYRSLIENLSPLPITLLNRFDLIFVVRDEPQEARDRAIASHIVDLHMGSAEINPPIPFNLLRKYIAYAKRITPKLTPEVKEAIVEFYGKMRRATIERGDTIAITPRQLESIIRLAEARARLHLRDKVTIEDVEAAKNLVLRSLRDLEIDIDAEGIEYIITGKKRSLMEKMEETIKIIKQMERQSIEGIAQTEEVINQMTTQLGINEAEAKRILELLKRDGTIYQPRPNAIKTVNL